MKYYDARIIQGCCVFSYEVKTPDSSSKKGKKKKNTKRSAFSLKKLLLRIFLLLLLPFTSLSKRLEKHSPIFLNRFCNGFKACFRCRELTACILSAVSAAALIPLILLLL